MVWACRGSESGRSSNLIMQNRFLDLPSRKRRITRASGAHPEKRLLLAFTILETSSQMLFSLHHVRDAFREEIYCEEASCQESGQRPRHADRLRPRLNAGSEAPTADQCSAKGWLQEDF